MKLVSQVIEIKDYWVAFATQFAGMFAQECEQVRSVAMATPQYVSRVLDALVGRRSTFWELREHELLKAQELVPAKVPGGAPSMAAGADYVTLGDLSRNRWPAMILADQGTYVGPFVVRVTMVELQYSEIANTAIHTLGIA